MNQENNIIYVFLHLPKTAGSTFRINLEKNFQADQLLFLYEHKNASLGNEKGVDDYISSLSDERKKKIRVIMGHQAYFGIDKNFDCEVRYITFLRDPQKLVVSWYNFLRMIYEVGDDKGDQILNNGQVMSFEEFLEKSNLHDTMMAKLISPVPLRVQLENGRLKNGFTEDDLSVAKNILDKCFFVGIIGQKDDFYYVYSLLGIKKIFPGLNVSKKYYQSDGSTKIQSLINQKVEWDKKLYDYAVVVNKNFKKNSDFIERVEEMKSKDTKLNRVMSWPFLMPNFFYDKLRMYPKLFKIVRKILLKK